MLGDHAVRDLAARVTVRCHGEDEVFRQRMTMRLKDGRVIERQLEDLKGMPERPLGPAELHAKLADAAAGKLPSPAIARIAQACVEVRIAPLLDALRAARPSSSRPRQS